MDAKIKTILSKKFLKVIFLSLTKMNGAEMVIFMLYRGMLKMRLGVLAVAQYVATWDLGH